MANVFLKNTATKWQSNLIDLNSAMMILNSQTLDQAKNWFVFVEDDKDIWLNVLDCALITTQLKNAVPAKIEVKNESIQVPFEMPVDIALESLAVEQQEPVPAKPASEEELSGAERRSHPRFDIRLRVIVKSGKNTYLTYTRDVSLGGLSLINDVPEYIFTSEAEIYITAPDQKNNIMFTCSPVASKLGKSRLMFTRIEESKQKILAAWLQHFVKPNAQKVS